MTNQPRPVDKGNADQMTRPTDILPLSCPPCGLTRVQSAAYICVGTTLFDEMVGDGRMPPPKRINSKTVWGRQALEMAFLALPSDADANPWDGGAG